MDILNDHIPIVSYAPKRAKSTPEYLKRQQRKAHFRTAIHEVLISLQGISEKLDKVIAVLSVIRAEIYDRKRG